MALRRVLQSCTGNLSPQVASRRACLTQRWSSMEGDAADQRRPPFPPFTEETAKLKVQMAEDGWNSRDPHKVAKAYTKDSDWRNRTEFFKGREAIVEFLTRKWKKELDYKLMKELWCYQGNRIGVRFEYEWHDQSGQWYRTHGNEFWEFNDDGLMRRRDMSANDYPIKESERRIKVSN